jgi:shikimate dehydrogenase
VRALSAEAIGAAEATLWGQLAPGAQVLDLNYGARAHESRERAAAGKYRFEDGVELLLQQGALSYEFWMGEPAPLPAMRAALEAQTNSP